METLIEFIKSSQEVQKLWTIEVTIVFFLTIANIVLEGLGVWDQWKTMRKEKKSGRNIYVPIYVHVGILFPLYLHFGVISRSLSLILDGLQLPLYLLILYGVGKYEGFSKRDYIISFILLLFMVPTYIAIEDKELGMTLMLFAAIPLFWVQMLKIKREGRGAIDIDFLWKVGTSHSIWLLYGIAYTYWSLILGFGAYVLLIGLMIYFWNTSDPSTEAPDQVEARRLKKEKKKK